MEDILEVIIKNLIGSLDYKIDKKVEKNNVYINIYVSKSNMKKIIGYNGQTIKAIETIIRSFKNTRKRMILKVNEMSEDEINN